MPQIDPTAWVAPGAVVLGDVTLKAQVSIWYGAIVRGDMAPIFVGEACNVQDGAILHVDEGVPCVVGDRVGVGHRAILHGCVVENDTLIGMGAVLLNHVRIGTGSVVGAGAVVPEGVKIPDGSLVLGVPARVVRPVDEGLRRRIASTVAHYVELSAKHRAGEFL